MSKQEIAPVNFEIVQLWVQLASFLGLQKSVGQIFGVLFVSNHGLCADDCVELLGISRSSVSQGLKALEEIGAIRKTFKLGERRDVYQIEPDLGNIANHYLESRVLPSLEELDKITKEFAGNPEIKANKFLLDRIMKMQRWTNKTHRVFQSMKID
jgi:DNA-binding transcriptional regulator GbsR (MarR family)